MFDVNIPYNDLPPITEIQLNISPELARFAEDMLKSVSQKQSKEQIRLRKQYRRFPLPTNY